ncbi:DUF3883 domain-containing protein [Undibacterium sp. CY21W]|uniref:DUF3883 domain-containing protein n=1 Tax=Undibacterium sp. CY21W TaxID=2762293 RepID=UPI00164AE284|nr:DUF3883 domain-containing protein [Undibacterium sp. CY21W]MBC3928600.1 DUF3883 domain-containing protein [Undibacterium sp. CY21W]
MKKVLWVKFGWSEYYRGGSVDGNFAWLHDNKEKGSERRGHEAFNFNPGPDGQYYCYVPPQKGQYAPSHEDPHGWTVICLAKNPKHTGVHVVGWYEDATLHGKWNEPPHGTIKKRGDTIHPAYDWSYCISSKTAYFISPEDRTMPFSDSSIRQGKYSFLEGPNVNVNESKKRVLKLLEERLKALLPFAIKNPDENKLPDPELDATDPFKGFGTPEHRKKVEIAAEKAVIEYYKKKGFVHERVTNLPCGYDFIFKKGKLEFHVEVKGTASTSPKFYLTRNEHVKGLQSNPNWRLVMVTAALSANPVIAEYNAAELTRTFDLEPYVFMGTFVPIPHST